MAHLAPLSTACHKSSSSHLIHLNHPSIPSPRLEKSRGGLAREGEFLADQACLSVQASPKKKQKNTKKTPILGSGLLCPIFLYSFFFYRKSMWFFLLVLIVPSAYNYLSLCKPCTLLACFHLPTK